MAYRIDDLPANFSPVFSSFFRLMATVSAVEELEAMKNVPTKRPDSEEPHKHR